MIHKNDMGKVRYDLIDPEAIHGLALAMTNGTTKYPEYSWQKVPVEKYVAAYQRHMHKHLRYMRTGVASQAYADDSNILHIDHAMACLMILRWFAVQDKNIQLRELRNEKTREASLKETTI